MRDEAPTLQIRMGETELSSYSHNRAPVFIDLVNIAWAAIDDKGEWDGPFIVGGTFEEYLDSLGLQPGDTIIYRGADWKHEIQRHTEPGGGASLVRID